MKLTISTLACPKWTLEQIAQTASACGIQGIDFRGLGEQLDVTLLPQFNQNLPETLSLLKRYKLEVPCYQSSVALATSDPQKWQTMLEETQRTAVVASKTNTPFVRVFGGVAPAEMPPAEVLQLAQRHARQLIKICSAHGCIPIVETHDAWSSSGRLMELLHEFDPNEIGALWDLEHPSRRGESPTDTFATLKRFLRHIHIKDTIRIDKKGTQKLLGEGELPLKPCLQALREGGYDGWVCLETEKRWDAKGPEPEVSIPRFAEFMREAGCA